MNILLLDSGYNLNVLVDKFSENEKIQMIFVLSEIYPENSKTFCVDLNKNVDEIIDFVEANDIDFTVCMDSDLIEQNIKEQFEQRNLLIFAASFNSVKMAFFNSIAKKFIYKNNINTFKFGVFEKENQAISYLEENKFPVIIKSDYYKDANPKIFETYSSSVNCIKKMFFSGVSKIVIEEYRPVDYFNYYIISDGNRFFPLSSVEVLENGNKRFSLAPSSKLDYETEQFIIKKIIAPIMASIKQNTKALNGLLGFEFGIDKQSGEPLLLGFMPQFDEKDLSLILNLLNEDIFDIFYLSSINALSDEYPQFTFKNEYSALLEVNKAEIIDFDGIKTCFKSEDKEKVLISCNNSTIKNVMQNLRDSINEEN